MQIHSLGIKIKNVDGMIGLLKAGFSPDQFDRLRDTLGVTDKRLASIVNINKRTLSRRRAEGRLRPDESERLLRVAKVFDKAYEVFEGKEAAKEWLKAPARGLGGRIPLEYTDTELGAQEVINLLGRIEHGVFPG